jgi:DNA-binding LytR/AlgR family response regulator
MNYNCLLVDDEYLALELLEEYVNRIPNLNVIGKLDRASNVIPFLTGQSVDLLFLDIEMPGIDGISLLKKVALKPLTIFTTAHRKYAFDGFDLGVIDYLLKPIKWERFKQSIDKVYAQLRTSDLTYSTSQGETISINSGDKKQVIHLTEILFIQAAKDYSVIFTGDKNHMLRKTLKNLEQLLLNKGFMRVHKSYLMSVAKIRTLKNGFIVINNHKVPIGRAYKEDVFKSLNDVKPK